VALTHAEVGQVMKDLRVESETGVIAEDLLQSCKCIKDGMQFVSSAFIWNHQDSVPQDDILRGMVALRNSDELE
jgi:hypothetical protein